MKKTLIAIIFLISCNGLVKAQTKEETITWLKEKMQSYLIGVDASHTYSRIKVESLTECEMVISYTENFQTALTNGDTRDVTHYMKIVAPTKSIESVSPNFKYPLNAVKTITERTDLIDISRYVNVRTPLVGYSGQTFSSYILLKIDERETNIQDRVMKAFAHLASFCPTTKKEAF